MRKRLLAGFELSAKRAAPSVLGWAAQFALRPVTKCCTFLGEVRGGSAGVWPSERLAAGRVCSPDRRQLDQARPVQLEHEAAGHHALQPAVVLPPVRAWQRSLE